MRALIAFVLLAATASTASAFARRVAEPYISTSCDVTPGILPSDGSTNVPRNAHAWVFGGTSGDYHLRHGKTDVVLKGTVHDPFRVVEVPLGELDPNTTYTLAYADQVLTTFTTGTRDDVEPPISPSALTWNLTTHTGMPVNMTFEAPPDTAILKLTIATDDRKVSMLAPAASLHRFGAECAGASLRVGQYVCFDIAAIDLAGNLGSATRFCNNVTEAPSRQHYSSDAVFYPEPSPVWPVVVFLLGASLVVSIGVAFRMGHNARRACSRPPATQVHAELVRRLATTARTRAEWSLAVSGVVLVLLDLVPEVTSRALFASAPLALAVFAIAKAQRMHQLLRDLDDPAATVGYDGSRYAFTQNKTWMIVYPNQLARVTKAAVPTAKVR